MFYDIKYNYKSIVYILLFANLFIANLFISKNDNVILLANILIDIMAILIFIFSFIGLERILLLCGVIIGVLVLNISFFELQIHLNEVKADIFLLRIKNFLRLITVPLFVLGFMELFKDKLLNRKINIKPQLIIIPSVILTIILQIVLYSKIG